MLGCRPVGQGQVADRCGERRGGDLGRRLVDAEGVGGRRRVARQRGLVGLADDHGHGVLEALGQRHGRRHGEDARGVRGRLHVEGAGVAAAAAADRQGRGAAVVAAELDEDLVAGDRARERHVHLADELGLAEVRVLVARDARVRARVHRERRDRRGLERLEAQVLDEVVGLALGEAVVGNEPLK